MGFIKKALFLILILIPVAIAQGTPAAAFDPLQGACSGNSLSPTCQQSSQQQGSSTNPITDSIHRVADIIAVVAGVAAVIMIILGGLSYVTSGGKAEQAASAQRRIIGAVIGLAVVSLAWVITTFVVDHFVQ